MLLCLRYIFNKNLAKQTTSIKYCGEQPEKGMHYYLSCLSPPPNELCKTSDQGRPHRKIGPSPNVVHRTAGRHSPFPDYFPLPVKQTPKSRIILESWDHNLHLSNLWEQQPQVTSRSHTGPVLKRIWNPEFLPTCLVQSQPETREMDNRSSRRPNKSPIPLLINPKACPFIHTCYPPPSDILFARNFNTRSFCFLVVFVCFTFVLQCWLSAFHFHTWRALHSLVPRTLYFDKLLYVFRVICNQEAQWYWVSLNQ